MLCRVLCVLLFLFWTAEPPLELDKILFCGLWRSPMGALGFLWVPLPVIHQPALKVVLVVMAPLCLLWPGAFRKRPWVLDGAILASLGALLATLFWGLWRGGSSYQTYFQLNAFVTAMFTAVLLMCVLRTPRDLRALAITVLVAAVLRATLVWYFYLNIRGLPIVPFPQYMTTHDDSLLFVAALLITLSWALARRSLAALLTAASVFGFLLVAIMFNNRRLAWMELLLALAVIYRMLPAEGTADS